MDLETETEYVRAVSTWQSGGNVMVDIVELKDGRVLGISDDSVVLYPSLEAMLEGETVTEAGMIALA